MIDEYFFSYWQDENEHSCWHLFTCDLFWFPQRKIWRMSFLLFLQFHIRILHSDGNWGCKKWKKKNLKWDSSLSSSLFNLISRNNSLSIELKWGESVQLTEVRRWDVTSTVVVLFKKRPDKREKEIFFES